MPDVRAVEEKCRSLADAMIRGVAVTHGKIRNTGLSYPADIAAYLTIRELDEKGKREVPEHRLKVIDFGVKSILG